MIQLPSKFGRLKSGILPSVTPEDIGATSWFDFSEEITSEDLVSKVGSGSNLIAGGAHTQVVLQQAGIDVDDNGANPGDACDFQSASSTTQFYRQATGNAQDHYQVESSSGDGSIEFVLFPINVTGGRVWCHCGNTSVAGDRGLIYQTNAAVNRWTLSYFSGGSFRVAESDVVTINLNTQWYHLALTIENLGTQHRFIWYINGVASGTTVSSNKVTEFPSTHGMNINGARESGAPQTTSGMLCMLDTIAVYRGIVLSSGDILSRAQSMGLA